MSQNSKHTKGKWRIVKNGAELSVMDSKGGYICDVSGEATDPEVLANANILASSTDLLKSLQHAMKFLESLPMGWLGKTTGDVEALNDFYLTAPQALVRATGQEVA